MSVSYTHLSLKLAKEKIQSGERNAVNIIEVIENNIKSEKLAKIDYIEIVDSNSCLLYTSRCV